jgi:hypothetical protein
MVMRVGTEWEAPGENINRMKRINDSKQWRQTNQTMNSVTRKSIGSWIVFSGAL